MFALELPSLSVLVVILIVSEILIGWIPWFIAYYRQARHRNWIGACGIVFAPLPILFLGVLFWSLLGRPIQPDGPGFPIEGKKNGRG